MASPLLLHGIAWGGIFLVVCCVNQGRRWLGIMKRNGAELMRRWEKRWRMCGRWMKRSGRIFMRLLKEVNGGGFSGMEASRRSSTEDF
jgi:hypothetical protein